MMLEKNLMEDDITRIGSEQEFCLIDNTWRPARNSEDILKDINDPHFTTELAKFNLEINLDPIELKGACFKKFSNQLVSFVKKAKDISAKHDTKVILTGILPTISENELEQDYMTSRPRYQILNEKYKEIRGDDFKLHISGLDELRLYHDSILFEACNTSFQMHLQIASHDFISSYNWAKAISGPLLGICTNSPLLLGRELWSETRVALFRQSIDTRMASRSLKDQDSRVTFGNNWATGTVADIFKDDIANFKILISKENTSDSLEALKKGKTPKLEALSLHNGTIYRWNRACYGITNGKPHVRIENRYIPSGPSIIDEMANFAFWVGIMVGRPPKYNDMPHVMDFRDAKSNFVKAARLGSDALLKWDGKKISVKKLAYKILLPIAHKGLKKAGINNEDRKYFLGIIEKRIKGQSGSEWMTDNYRVLKDLTSKDNALRLLTRAIYNNQIDNTPAHNWPPIKGDGFLKESAQLVGQIMSTKLFTVHEKSLANLATSLMKWKNIHHVPVENEMGNLTGLLTWTHAQKFQDIGEDKKNENQIVCQIMQEDVITVTPQTHIIDAIHTMKKHNIGCLPVVKNLELVGIITINDLIGFYYD
ncbi:MAG: CBS domain-containing protein [Ulvibacter sp.]|jgi:CBS domain-containing protein